MPTATTVPVLWTHDSGSSKLKRYSAFKISKVMACMVGGGYRLYPLKGPAEHIE